MKFFMMFILFIVVFIVDSNLYAQSENEPSSQEVYKSDDLIIIQITENSFVHTSFKHTNDFGNVPCNGLIIRNANEVIVFDTPPEDKTSEELIKWINETLNCKIKGIIPTHFHDDCLGGLKVFHKHKIPSYAFIKTIDLTKDNNYVTPQNSFRDSITLNVGNEIVFVKFFGEGHTIDNVIGFFPSEKVMFGGCLIKSLNAGKGYLGDANVVEWSTTVEKIKNELVSVNIIVPGHGKFGSKKLLDYTIDLFKTQ